LHLVDPFDVRRALLGDIHICEVPVLLLDVEVVDFPGVGLFDLLRHAEVLLACLLWGDDLHIVHVDLVHAIVGFAPIQLSEYGLPELIVGHEIPCLVAPDQLVHLGVYRDLVLVQLGSEVVCVHVPLRVLLDRLCHLLLVLINSRSGRSCLFVSGSSVEVEIVWIHWRVVRAILLLILLHSQRLSNLGIGAICMFLGPDVRNELWSGFDAQVLSNV